MPKRTDERELFRQLLSDRDDEREFGGDEETKEAIQKLALQLGSLDDRTFHSREDMVAKLRSLLDAFREEQQLSVGDIVQWKEGLRNRRYPRYKEPVIVVELLESPVLAGNDAGAAHFRESLDIVLGWLDREGDLTCFHYDSRRFRKSATSTA